MSTIELVAAALTLLAVWLTTRQVVWCWPLGMVSVVLYGLVFYRARLYADAGLQVLYFALAAYGWWAWRHGGEDDGELAVSTASPRARLALLALGAVGGLALGQGLSRLTDASLPFLDSLLTSFSVIGQWMQARKLLEAWIVWLAVDILYVGMFLYKGLHATAVLYAVFLWLAAVGLSRWRHSIEGSKLRAGAEVAS